MWARVPEFPLEFYNQDILFSVGKCLGSPIKIDQVTYWASKGKYACVCVEVDFTKPLVSRIMVDETLFNIEYENFSTICFRCGESVIK